jgi:hypothetical protein
LCADRYTQSVAGANDAGSANAESDGMTFTSKHTALLVGLAVAGGLAPAASAHPQRSLPIRPTHTAVAKQQQQQQQDQLPGTRFVVEPAAMR